MLKYSDNFTITFLVRFVFLQLSICSEVCVPVLEMCPVPLCLGMDKGYESTDSIACEILYQFCA